MRIIGLDPGLQRTGWGVIDCVGNDLRAIAHGVIAPSPRLAFAQRLKILYTELSAILTLHAPDEAAIEETFVNVNATTSLKLGMARGVLLLAPAMAGLSVSDYAANTVKKAVVGQGHADKSQIAMMVQRLLVGCAPVDGDAADALAVAICHAYERSTQERLSAWAR